jgi:hypothetical protein
MAYLGVLYLLKFLGLRVGDIQVILRDFFRVTLELSFDRLLFYEK